MTSNTALPVELLPCPWCGNTPDGIVDATKILGVYSIVHRCKIIPGFTLEGSRPERVAQTWNTRATRTAVKPLEWEAHGKFAELAATAFGEYSIEFYEESDGCGWECVYNDAGTVGYFPTDAEAKTAAQDDYERRILSALVDPVVAQDATTPTCKRPLQVAAEGE